MPIYFHSEDIDFKLSEETNYRKWIEEVILSKGLRVGTINVVFTSNEYLLKINKEFLKHNYYTDVITFGYNEGNVISGDIFISIEQVEINRLAYNVDFLEEVDRVVIHGILHLIGFDDKDKFQKEEMTKQENDALNLRGRYWNE